MILKSDGASLYNTTDLATIVQRMEDFHPDEIIYVVISARSFILYPGVPLCEKSQHGR